MKNAEGAKSPTDFSWLRGVLEAEVLKFSMRTAGVEPLQQSCSTTGFAHDWTTWLSVAFWTAPHLALALSLPERHGRNFCCPVMGTVTRTSDCVLAEWRPLPFRTLSPWPRFIMSGAFFALPPVEDGLPAVRLISERFRGAPRTSQSLRARLRVRETRRMGKGEELIKAAVNRTESAT